MSFFQTLVQAFTDKPDESVKHTVLFDADCGFCQHSINRFKRWGGEVRMDFKPNTQDETVLTGTGVTREDLGKAVVMVSRQQTGELAKVRIGAGCVNHILLLLPGLKFFPLRLLSLLYYIPIIHQLEDIGYRLVANNRGFISKLMGIQACSIS